MRTGIAKCSVKSDQSGFELCLCDLILSKIFSLSDPLSLFIYKDNKTYLSGLSKDLRS